MGFFTQCGRPFQGYARSLPKDRYLSETQGNGRKDLSRGHADSFTTRWDGVSNELLYGKITYTKIDHQDLRILVGCHFSRGLERLRPSIVPIRHVSGPLSPTRSPSFLVRLQAPDQA